MGMWGLLRRLGNAGGPLATFVAVAACALGAVPAFAHTDGVRRAATIHIYATVQPVAPSDPRWAPPTLNGEADFRVTFSTRPPSCATLTALMTVDRSLLSR